ncbi:aspartic proteinase CDR1-like [Mangifera indica]|uniref:aspartic proteinase CDR1-like n=1 Tax=Mangifera indica TaxID=29780 RepID=UPI001CFBCCF7|nr:aspartic proteinase CDR1-like [Mangifera indica]
MATLLAFVNVFMLFSSTLLIFHVHFTLSVNTTMKVKPLKFKLHHPETVFYTPNATIEDRGDRLLKASINRLYYLSARAGGGDPEYDALAGLVTSRELGRDGFFVDFSIGDPPVSQFALMDTGSDLVWVDCLTGFDPSESRTFAQYPCLADCNNGCSSTNGCMLQIGYVGGFSAGGVIAREKFTFQSSREGDTIVNDVVFGCFRKFSKTNKILPGIFGLGDLRTEFSIVKKMGSKFSYCLGNIYDESYIYNQLRLGEGTFLEGMETPLSNYVGVYHVDFEGISLGETRLDIDPNLFKRGTSSLRTGVAIDTGSHLSWFVPMAFKTIRSEVAKLIDQEFKVRRRYEEELWELCYFGDLALDFQSFPHMKFHLANGAYLDLDSSSLFYQKQTRVFCLGIGPSNEIRYHNFSLIGLMAQQKHNIAYDLTGKKLYIQKINCSLLDED